MGNTIQFSQGVSQEEFINATNGLHQEIDDLEILVDSNYDEFVNATNGLHQEIDDLQTQIDNIDSGGNDYTTAGLVTEQYVIDEIIGKQVETDIFRFYDKDNVSQALTLETFIEAKRSTCEFVRDNTWKTEILGITVVTSTASASAGVPDLNINIYEYTPTGGQRGFGQGTLLKNISVQAPIPSSYYNGSHDSENANPISVTADTRIFVDVQHSGGWNYRDLQVKIYVKYTKIA